MKLRSILNKFAFAFLSLLSVLMLSSCWILAPFQHEEEKDPLGIEEDVEPRRQDIKNYTFYKVEDLKRLTSGHYEGWIYQENAFISTGKFNIGYSDIYHIQTKGRLNSGKIVDLLSTPIPNGRFENYEAFNNPLKSYITIETIDDNDHNPGLFFLTGDVVKNKSSLAFRLISSSDIGGTFRVGTYSDDDPDNEGSGIWFFKPSVDKLGRPVNVSSLTLPNAPDGFIYEAWVKREFVVPANEEKKTKARRDEQYLSLGKFRSAGQDDLKNTYGPSDARSVGFPGNDLLIHKEELKHEIEFPVDLTSGEYDVVISLEPYIDGVDLNGDLIYAIIMHSAHITKGAPVHTDRKITSDWSKFPTGNLAIR